MSENPAVLAAPALTALALVPAAALAPVAVVIAVPPAAAVCAAAFAALRARPALINSFTFVNNFAPNFIALQPPAPTTPALTICDAVLCSCIKLVTPPMASLALSIKYLTGSSKLPPTSFIKPSKLDSKIAWLPLRLSFITAAMLLAVPVAAYISCSDFCNLPVLASFIHASAAALGSLPNIASKYAMRVPSPIFSVARAKSCIRPGSLRIRPSLSMTGIFSAASASSASFGGLTTRSSIAREAVPPCEPLIPTFASDPNSAAMSSMFTPSPAATGATYFIASPSSAMLVLVLTEALANTSATRPASLASSVKPRSELAMTSAALAKSMPSAAAMSKSPGSASLISSALKPARANTS